ncbi:MAG TPA: OmpA family protein [Azospira sp.]|nr:OmpA family protein [Azospira sp.]
MNNKRLSIILAAIGTIACVAPALADTPTGAYLTDSRNVVAKSGFGLCWRTSSWTPAAAIAECDPDLVPKTAPTATAAPVPAAAAAPAKKCDFTVTLQSDELFAFNKATLSPAAQKRLDSDVVGKLANCASVSMVMVTGHTDRLGSQQYNQKLSEKRADAVKGFLQKKGVPADKIDTMGAGKTQPAQGVKCEDKLPRKKLIECLAPSRRVVVEVRGTAK